MDERKLEKRLRRLEEALEAQVHREQHLGRKVEALAGSVEALIRAVEVLLPLVERMEHQIKRIERELKPHHYPATTGIRVTAS